MSAGKKFQEVVAQHTISQCLGATSAYHAILADKSGAQLLYVSGGGVAANSCGIPDLGITTLADVETDVRRITRVTDKPILVDIDTGWGGFFNIARAIKTIENAGGAAVHIEDQIQQKRCGHRPNKAIVSQQEMVDRVKAAVDARVDNDFVIMARTDALAVEGMNSAIERASACAEAGADMVFPEAMTALGMYQKFVDAVTVPVLANITEFASTPLFTTEELASVGVKVALYPLSAFRAASQAALQVYQAVLAEGSQQSVVEFMQTREDLYDYLDYHRFEQTLDAVLVSEE